MKQELKQLDQSFFTGIAEYTNAWEVDFMNRSKGMPTSSGILELVLNNAQETSDQLTQPGSSQSQ